MLHNVRNGLIMLIISLIILPDLRAMDERFGILEKTGEQLPGQVMLLNEDSAVVRFGDLIDKPTLLSFVYYRCPGLCSPVMAGIAEIIEKSDLIPGRDYQIITLSIDHKENISLARAKKASYIHTIRKDARLNWQFFVADSMAIKTLTDAAGWEFKRSGNDFVHSAATLMITPGRRISQYFYGTFILPMHFHMAVNDAGNEICQPSRMKDQKYCYNYTPPVNRAYSMIVSSAGIGILSLAIILFIWLSLTSRKTSQHGFKVQ
jgi:protein SCO1/2